jgi:hypothetical protein
MNTIRTAIDNLTLIRLLILTFGVFSITRLITTDTFPLFEWARNWIFDRFPKSGHQTKKRPTRGKWIVINGGGGFYVNEGVWLGELISCPWCAGFYVSLAAVACYVWAPYVAIAGCLVMGLRATTGLLAGLSH